VRIFSPVAVIALFVYSIWATFAPEEEAQAAEAPAQEQVDAVTSDAPAQQDTAAPLPQEGGTKVPVEQESP
jgi:NSS family neurotransmitter:Na+ symporter